MGWRAAVTATALVAPLLSACGGSSATAITTSTTTSSTSGLRTAVNFPRSETLYTSGTAYSAPTNFNPLDTGNFYTGTMGLLYEPLFLYNPNTDGYVPWLATAGGWSGNTYTVDVRNGVRWTNGSALTGADVAFSINLATTNPGVPYSNLGPYIRSVTASGNIVKVRFTNPAPYATWQRYLWNQPVLPRAVFSRLSPVEQVTSANLAPVSTGPMTLVSAGHTRACYQDNPDWWGTEQLGLSFHFKYLCDVVNGSNSVELSDLLTDRLDWSNNFLPGINLLMTTGGDSSFLRTYYPTAPYMIAANTVWLEMNTTKAPMSNLDFRKAVATAIDPEAIVNGVYNGLTEVANPVGLLPNLASYVNQRVVDKYGFSYSPSRARQFLADSGYKGQTLTLQVPADWTDWMAANGIIAEELGAAGIRVQLLTPSANVRTKAVEDGDFDMLLDNNAGPDSTPWSYFDRVYQLPVPKTDVAELNVERYIDPATWKLVEEAGTTPTSDKSALENIYSQIETDFLGSLPEIPLWYNSAWFQGNTHYWKDYPSFTNPTDSYTPIMWAGWLGCMTTVLGLADLRPATRS
jgi:peptide/nickel transport system substrate-binding protein